MSSMEITHFMRYLQDVRSIVEDELKDEKEMD